MPKKPIRQAKTSHQPDNSSRTNIVVALIGAFAIIIAAVIGGLFLLAGKGSTSYLTPTPASTLTPVSDPASTLPNISDGQRQYSLVVAGRIPDWADNLTPPDPANGWTYAGGEPTGCLFQAEGQNTQKFYYAYSHTPGYVGLCFANKSYANFAYQVHMTVQQGDGGGLIFRSTTPDFNSAMYRFDVRPGLQVFDILIQTDNAKRTNSVCDGHGNTYCFSLVINKIGENTLSMLAKGNLLYFYINGICVVGVKDNTISTGYIGVYAVDQQHKTDVAFDSAEVWQIS